MKISGDSQGELGESRNDSNLNRDADINLELSHKQYLDERTSKHLVYLNKILKKGKDPRHYGHLGALSSFDLSGAFS